MINLKSKKLNPFILSYIWLTLIPYLIFAFDKKIFFYFFDSKSLAGIISVAISVSGPIIFLSHLVLNGDFIQKRKHIYVLILGFLFFTIASVFKILHFPGAGVLIIGACIFPIIAYGLISLKKSTIKPMDYLKIAYVGFFFITRLLIFMKQGDWFFYTNIGEQITLILMLSIYTLENKNLSR